MYRSKSSFGDGAVSTGGFDRKSLSCVSALSASSVHLNLSWRLRRVVPVSKSRDEPIESGHAACEFLHILDASWCLHVCDGRYLLWVGLNAAMANDEPE